MTDHDTELLDNWLLRLRKMRVMSNGGWKTGREAAQLARTAIDEDGRGGGLNNLLLNYNKP